MEAYIVLKGKVGIKAPRQRNQVTEKEIIDRYEDVIWEKSDNGLRLRDHINKMIENNIEPADRKYNVWMFDIVREVEPTDIFGDVVLIQPKPRTTTAICLEQNTELLTLSNESY